MRALAVAAIALLVAVGAGSSATAAGPSSHAGDGYGWPAWWNGSDCDAQHWDAASAAQGWRGAGAHELGASYLGVPVCGPRPTADGAPAVWWTNWAGGEREWTDTELAFRFMALVYGTGAYPATGAAVVSNYRSADGGQLKAIANDGTAGRTPLPGSILSFSSASDPAGHVAIVTGNTVDQSGNGSLTVMSQDDTADGWRTLTVSNWTIQGYGDETPTGWLASAGPYNYGYPGGLIPEFDASPSDPHPGAPVFFNAESSQDPIGNIFAYLWQFGDGTYGQGEYALHTYASSGTYSVTLTITDDLLNSSSFTEQVTVAGAQDLVYVDRKTGALRHGTATGGGWQFQTVDGPGATGVGRTRDKLAGPVATSTPGGTESLWYFDAKTGALRRAYRKGSGWATQIVDGPGSSGVGHTTHQLGGSVVATTVRGQTTTCKFLPSTTCSTPWSAQVWYLDAQTGALRHAWWTGSKWAHQVVDGAGARAAGHTRHRLGSLSAITAGDTVPALWYLDRRSKGLREAVWTGKAWRLRTLDGPGSKVQGHTRDTLAGPVAAIAPYTLPNVSYFDARSGALRDAYWTGAAWQFTTVDGPHASGGGHTTHRLGGAVTSAAPPLAPQMWYLDARTGALRHAWWENFTWRSEIVDGPHAGTNGATHDRLSGPLAVATPAGLSSVLYLDARTGAIRQASWTGAGWHVSTIEGHPASALATGVS